MEVDRSRLTGSSYKVRRYLKNDVESHVETENRRRNRAMEL